MPPPPGKVIQIAPWHQMLLVLTDLGDIWVIQGLGTQMPGTVERAKLQWRKLDFPIDPEPLTMW